MKTRAVFRCVGRLYTKWWMSALGQKRTSAIWGTTKIQSAAYEIDPALDRHEVEDGPVLRRERLDVSSAILVRFSERVLLALGREQDARLGKRDPSPLVRWQCRQGAGKCGRGCSVELHGIGGSGSVCPK